MADLEVVDSGRKPRWTAQELLTLIVGVTIAGVFLLIVLSVCVAILSPAQTAEMDLKLVDNVLVPIVLFATGALSGVLAGNGLSKTPSRKRTEQADA